MAEPWHDTPLCKDCGCPLVTKARHESVHERWPGDDAHRLCCIGCGTTCAGTDAEVGQAKKADAAWEAASMEVA